jgi:uncharacterized protein YjbJ (UPF0337 family)
MQIQKFNVCVRAQIINGTNEKLRAVVQLIRGSHLSAHRQLGKYLSITKESDMNMDRIEGSWRQLKGNVKQQWGRLTNDQFMAMEGKRDQTAGKNQVSYGLSMETAMKQQATWQTSRKEK